MNSPLFARLSEVVPAYNEEATLAQVVGKLLGLSHLHEVIVVDDCSTDRTNEIARELAEKNPSLIQVIRHKKNAGFCRDQRQYRNSPGR
jgi:glycosyltransferase involved in cell wall biosynthesis